MIVDPIDLGYMDYTPVGLSSGEPSSPPLSTFDGVWNSISTVNKDLGQWLRDEAGEIYSGFTGTVSTIYGDISEGAGTIFKDVSSPVSDILENTYWKMILGVVVIGVILVYVGKTGAVKISR